MRTPNVEASQMHPLYQRRIRARHQSVNIWRYHDVKSLHFGLRIKYGCDFANRDESGGGACIQARIQCHLTVDRGRSALTSRSGRETVEQRKWQNNSPHHIVFRRNQDFNGVKRHSAPYLSTQLGACIPNRGISCFILPPLFSACCGAINDKTGEQKVDARRERDGRWNFWFGRLQKAISRFKSGRGSPEGKLAYLDFR